MRSVRFNAVTTRKGTPTNRWKSENADVLPNWRPARRAVKYSGRSAFRDAARRIAMASATGRITLEANGHRCPEGTGVAMSTPGSTARPCLVAAVEQLVLGDMKSHTAIERTASRQLQSKGPADCTGSGGQGRPHLLKFAASGRRRSIHSGWGR